MALVGGFYGGTFSLTAPLPFAASFPEAARLFTATDASPFRLAVAAARTPTRPAARGGAASGATVTRKRVGRAERTLAALQQATAFQTETALLLIRSRTWTILRWAQGSCLPNRSSLGEER